jgi:hypothetical protein
MHGVSFFGTTRICVGLKESSSTQRDKEAMGQRRLVSGKASPCPKAPCSFVLTLAYLFNPLTLSLSHFFQSKGFQANSNHVVSEAASDFDTFRE